VRPAPGKEWLTLVEFDIHIAAADINDEISINKAEARRNALLSKLLAMVKNSSSILYTGFISCKIDPTYNKYFLGDGSEDDSSTPFSTDVKVLEIMNKYKDVALPSDNFDVSHFYIYVTFEGVTKSLKIPNPLILRRKFCNLWPFEVKKVLGFLGTMQELWIEPVALIPRGVPREVSQAISFEPSARLGGAVVINATRLKADLTYEVQCEDYRGEVIKTLTEEERASIKETFDVYDADGSGQISRDELENLLRNRTAERKAAIDAKFQDYLLEAASAEDINRAEEQKRMYYQQLNEAQSKLVKMFDAADGDGNGQLSFTEFLLAEAWWIRCTLNPDHAHLF
jgi:hypothetical protein